MVLRLLLHDSSRQNTDSLLSYLNINEKRFIDSAKFHYPFKPKSGECFDPSALPLIEREITIPVKTKAILDSNSENEVKIDFQDWWEQKILELEPVQGNPQAGGFTRKNLVLTVAENLGGAHAARSFDNQIERLVRREGVGDKFGMNGEELKPILENEVYSIRQIAYETLKTLNEYFQ